MDLVMMHKNEFYKSLLWYIKLPFLVILFFLCQLMTPVAYVIWYIILKPLHLTCPKLFGKIEGEMFNAFLGMVAAELQLGDFEVLVSGDDWSKCVGEETIILPNHQCYSDIGSLLRFFQGHGSVFAKTNWIMDWIAQFSPVGWTSKGHGDFFLLQTVNAKQFSKIGAFNFDPEKCKNEMPVLLKRNLITNKMMGRNWLILFAEGGFLRKRKATSQRYALKHGLPVLEHVALPRVGAFQTIVDTLDISYQKQSSESYIAEKPINSFANPLKWVIDLTIAYERSESSVKCLLGFPQKISIHCRVIPASEIIGQDVCLDEREPALKTWLYDLFVNKNQLLANFYKHGCFVHSNNTSEKHVVRKCGVFSYRRFTVLCLCVLGTWAIVSYSVYSLINHW